MLIGNLGKDPDLQFLEGNIAVAKFSLATTETYKDRSGKLISQTEWHTVVLWRGLAELAQSSSRQLRRMECIDRAKCVVDGTLATDKAGAAADRATGADVVRAGGAPAADRSFDALR